MEGVAADLLPVVRVAAGVAFGALAAVAAVRASRFGRADWWLTAAFSVLTLVLLRSWVTRQLGLDAPLWLTTTELLVLLAFPYLLLRFTSTFRRLPRWLEGAAATAMVAVLLATLAWSLLSAAGGTLTWSAVYLSGAAAYWVLVSSVTVVRLWSAGHGQPTLARRRMRLMSAATALLAVALLVLVSNVGDDTRLLDLAVYAVVLSSGLAFGLGYSPPRALRLLWARREQQQLQDGTMALLAATTAEDVAEALLPPTVSIVGAAGAAVIDPRGEVVASHGDAPPPGTAFGPVGAATRDNGECEIVPLAEGHGHLVVWTSAYTPFFGREEVSLLHSMAAVAEIALQRSALLASQRQHVAMLEQSQQEATRAQQEAVQANMAKTGFLSRMSHELRTPLNAILGFGQLLELAGLNPEDDEAVAHILKAGRHLLALINDVLDLSRVEAGTLAISLEPVDAGELLSDTIALIQPMADTRAIQLTTKITDTDVYVHTDRQRCRQVLLNLLSNAVKYNRDGGKVTISCTPQDDTTFRIAVHDTGPGIDPARRQRLFEPFERLGAESSGVEGTGLGLALTKQLTEAMGGTIGVHTTPGAGSTFWIDLPVTQQPADDDQLTSGPMPTTIDTPRRTLLLVEDNLTNLRLVKAMLRRRPEISVLPAMQGQLAMDLAHEHQPDVIVLDLHLPDLSGREILQRLQADPVTRTIPVVIASADATPGRIRQLHEEGAFAYITKPLDVQPFLDVVDAAVAHRDAHPTQGSTTT